MQPLATFTGSVIHGSGRGREIDCPTMNISMKDAPQDIAHGVYACTVFLDDKEMPATLHFGPRPTCDDVDSCEVHVIDTVIDRAPDTLSVDIIAHLRGIEDYGSLEALKVQIMKDIDHARAIVSSSC